MKHVFITGGAGFIGSHVVKLYLENGYKVTVFDDLSHGFKQATDILSELGDLDFIKGDISIPNDLKNAFSKNSFDTVLHIAALASVNDSVEKPEDYFRTNVYGTLNVLEAMKNAKVKQLIFSSTCSVHGKAEYTPMDEQHPTHPTNPYSESKLIDEKIIPWFERAHGIKHVILRYFNVCGSDGMVGDSKKPSVLLLQNAVRGAMNIEPFYYTCPKVNTPDGTPIRDYIDVRDIASAHLLANKYLDDGKESSTFNLGTGKGYSVKEIVREVEKYFDVALPEKKGTIRKGEYEEVFADNKKAKEVLGWEPKFSLKESIESLKSWYSKFPNGYEY